MTIRQLASLLVVCLTSFAFAQQAVTDSAPAALRLDPHASPAVLKMQQATGWTSTAALQDVTAVGTITIFEDGKPSDVTGTITYKARGSGQASIETQYGDRHNKTVINGPHAASQTGVKYHPRNSQKLMAFPFMTDIAALNDASVQVKLKVSEELEGKPTQKLEVWHEPKETDRMPDEIRRFSKLILWIDTETGLLKQVEYRKANETQLKSLAFIRKYSDYRPVNGVMVPFHQEEWDQHEQMYAVDLKTVEFNRGLTADEFSVTPSRRTK